MLAMFQQAYEYNMKLDSNRLCTPSALSLHNCPAERGKKALSHTITATDHTSPPSVLITVRPHYRRCARRRADDINSYLTTDSGPRCAASVSRVEKLNFLFDRQIYLYDYINTKNKMFIHNKTLVTKFPLFFIAC